MTLVARGADTAAVVSGLRSALRSLIPVPLSNVKTMDERLVTATAAPRLTAVLTFALLTGLLAAIGDLRPPRLDGERTPA